MGHQFINSWISGCPVVWFNDDRVHLLFHSGINFCSASILSSNGRTVPWYSRGLMISQGRSWNLHGTLGLLGCYWNPESSASHTRSTWSLTKFHRTWFFQKGSGLFFLLFRPSFVLWGEFEVTRTSSLPTVKFWRRIRSSRVPVSFVSIPETKH